jgi:hypothetical protein
MRGTGDKLITAGGGEPERIKIQIKNPKSRKSSRSPKRKLRKKK